MYNDSEEILDHLKDGIYKLFLATGAKPDDFKTITGSSSITQANMIQYLGAFEVMVDDIIEKNEGSTCCELVTEEIDLTNLSEHFQAIMAKQGDD